MLGTGGVYRFELGDRTLSVAVCSAVVGVIRRTAETQNSDLLRVWR